jgi:protein farnesyltransferase subunit beta
MYRPADSYHSCYALSGLSSVQHYLSPSSSFDKSAVLSSAFHWEASKVIPTPNGKAEDTVFGEGDRVRLIHPVYVLPWGVAETTRAWFNGRDWSLV